MQRLNEFAKPNFEAIFGQMPLSAGLRVASILEKGIPHRYEPLIPPPLGDEKPIPISPESMNVLQLLNWIAMFLAHSSHDSIAAAITKDDKSLCIHLSINKDEVEKSDRSRASTMLHCIYQAMADQTQNSTKSQQQKPDLYNALISSIIGSCWPMISHRLEQLKNSIRNAGGVESLIGLQPQGDKHQDPSSTVVAAAKSSPFDHLRQHLNTLFTLTVLKTDEGTEDLRLQCLSTALSACEVLVKQNLVPRSDDDTWYAKLDISAYHTLDEVYRNVRSVYDYRSSTMEFMSGGIKLLRKEMATPTTEKIFGEKLKVVWVRDVLRLTLVSKCHWDLSPKEWLNKLFTTYSIPRSPICKPKSEEQKTEFLDHCGSFWKKGGAISAHVHPEVELLYYLAQHRENITLVCDAIGTDSDLCFACGLFFDKVDDHAKMHWLIRSSSLNKVQDDWLLPPVNKAHCVGKQKWAHNSAVQTGSFIRQRAALCIDAYLKKN